MARDDQASSPASSDDAPPRQQGQGGRAMDPLLSSAVPTAEAFVESPHRPLVVTQNPYAAAQGITMDGDASSARNLGGVNTRVIEVESELGWGKLEIHVNGTASAQPLKFDGKKRCVHVAVQARFKRRVPAGDLCVGQELYNEAAVPLWLSEALLTLAAKTFSATTRVSVKSKPRYFMNPVLAACQLVNVSKDGEQPGLWDAREDVRLMLPGAADSKGQPLASEARRKWCDAPANVAGSFFEPGLVYTFHFWQHYVDFGQYRLGIGFLNLDLASVLYRSPLQLTCKDVGTGLYAFSVLAWHERALYANNAPAGDDAESDTVAEAARQLEAQKLGGRRARLMAGLHGLQGLLTGRSP